MKTKIITCALFLSLTFTTAISCNNRSSSDVDSDFDGLPDNIDPDPHNNKYPFHLECNDKEEPKYKDDEVTVDYRPIVSDNPKYNYDTAKLASLLINDMPDFLSTYVPIITKNKYPASPSEIEKVVPLLAQIGGHNIEYKNCVDQYDVDAYDVVGVYMAHNTININGNKFQVFFSVIEPYPVRINLGWVSDLDIGDTKDIDNHPDWTNSAYHKGFEIAANRAIKIIDDYQNRYKNKDAKVFDFVTGHSRGAAIANIIGKKFTDLKRNVQAYCFATPNVVVEEDDSKLTKYTNIFNVVNEDDIVPLLPFDFWNFKRFGIEKKYRFSTAENILRFKEYFTHDYDYITPKGIKTIATDIQQYVNARDDTYSYSDIEEEDDAIYDSEIEARTNGIDAIKDSLKDLLTHDNVLANIQFDVKEETDEEWHVVWHVRPCLAFSLLDEFMQRLQHEESLGAILLHILKIGKMMNTAFSKIVGDIIPLIISGDFSVFGLVAPHIQPTSVLGVDLIK